MRELTRALASAGKSAEELREAVAQACPEGVHAYFDNVGGGISAAVAASLCVGARCGVCGTMSQMGTGGTDQAWVEAARARKARLPSPALTNNMW